MGTLCARLEKWLYKEDLAELHKAIYGNMGGSMTKKELVKAVTKGNPRKVLQKVAVGDMRDYYRTEFGRDPPSKADMVEEMVVILLAEQNPTQVVGAVAPDQPALRVEPGSQPAEEALRTLMGELSLSQFADAIIKEGYDSVKMVSELSETEVACAACEMAHRVKLYPPWLICMAPLHIGTAGRERLSVGAAPRGDRCVLATTAGRVGVRCRHGHWSQEEV